MNAQYFHKGKIIAIFRIYLFSENAHLNRQTKVFNTVELSITFQLSLLEKLKRFHIQPLFVSSLIQNYSIKSLKNISNGQFKKQQRRKNRKAIILYSSQSNLKNME